MDENPAFGKPNDPVTYSSEKWSLGWTEAFYRGNVSHIAIYTVAPKKLVDTFCFKALYPFKGYKKSSHSGGRDGYQTLLTLLPDMGIGVYVTLNRGDRNVRDLIHMYVLDLLLGVEPWLDIETACSLGQTIDMTKDSDIQEEINTDREEEAGVGLHNDQDYVGVYGNYAYGNTTVFINQTSDMLSLSYGAAEWQLTETSTNTFGAQGLEPFWYWFMTVTFLRDGDDVTEVTLPFQSGAHPTFVRGLDMSTAPPPPELCPSG